MQKCTLGVVTSHVCACICDTVTVTLVLKVQHVYYAGNTPGQYVQAPMYVQHPASAASNVSVSLLLFDCGQWHTIPYG